jgi:hypothetical protein
MRKLKRDVRGLPIPFVQFIDANGKPDFRVLDAVKVAKCVRNKLCGICGRRMRHDIFFIGGPLCEANGLFHDPGMHRDCATFALRGCAHLNRVKGRYSTAALPSEPGLHISTDPHASAEKAEWFGLFQTTKYDAITFGGVDFIRAKMPWLSVQRWRDGAPCAST